LLLALSLVACGGGKKGDEDATDTVPDTTPDTTGDTTPDTTPDVEPEVGPDVAGDGMDAAGDTGGDTGADGADVVAEAADPGDEDLSECARVLDCLMACLPTDGACRSSCMRGVSRETRTQIDAIYECVTRTLGAGMCTECSSGSDLTACWTCLESACSTEFAACRGS
jgi:hypothetical protein